MGNSCVNNNNNNDKKEISEDKIITRSSIHLMNEQDNFESMKLSHSREINRLSFKCDHQLNRLDSYHDIYFRYTPKHLLSKKRIR